MEINVLVDEELEGYIDSGWLRDISERVLATQNISSAAEMGLVITGQERIRQLNLAYLGKDRPTDVIAFSMLPEPPAEPMPAADLPPFVLPPDGVTHLGEVIISYPQAVIQAEEQQHPVKRELAILIIHGILHLLGYEDKKPELKRAMIAKEAAIMSYIEKETTLSLL